MAPDIKGQTRNALQNLRGVLVAGGSGLDMVLKVTVYMADSREFEAMNDVYKEFFPADSPCRSTVGVAALGKPEMRVEIEAVA
jgi:2-iminobutanoate/2-iminopropanoate deaminase